MFFVAGLQRSSELLGSQLRSSLHLGAARHADRGVLMQLGAVLRDEFGWHHELLAAEVVAFMGEVGSQRRVLAFGEDQFEARERRVGDRAVLI